MCRLVTYLVTFWYVFGTCLGTIHVPYEGSS